MAGQSVRHVAVVVGGVFFAWIGGGIVNGVPRVQSNAEDADDDGSPGCSGVAIRGRRSAWIYIALQRWELRRKSVTVQPRGVLALVPGAVGRLAFAGCGLGLVFWFTDADKYWLTGSLFVSYGVLFLWQLKQMVFPKK